MRNADLDAEVAIRHLPATTGDTMTIDSIESFLGKARENKHTEVVQDYLSLDDVDKYNPDVLMAYADSLYELSLEADAIDVYLNYASLYPNTRGSGFALYGAAMAFKNLELHKDALYLMSLIKTKANHPKLDDEISHSNKVLNEQNRATAIVSKFKSCF